MTRFISMTALVAGMASSAFAQDAPTTLTIATVNNGDMITMQALSEQFTAEHPDIELQWVTLEENTLRQRVTTDITTNGGQYDVVTIGPFEVALWGKQGWLTDLSDLGDAYQADDLLPSIRASVSIDGTLYASPFYGESWMIHYRKDLFDAAGLTMPEAPTWDFVREAADQITDREAGINGVCFRGKAGWGENMAFITALANTYGARWFDEEWRPQFDSPEWRAAIQYYYDIMQAAGPEGASTNGYNENLALFQQGRCGMWIDASVAAGALADPAQSVVADQVAWAVAPTTGLDNHGNWFWAWSLGIPSSSQNVDAAKEFVAWATSPAYLDLVAQSNGWLLVPPGTRQSLYDNPEYRAAAPFAETTLEAISEVNMMQPSVQPVPYTGGQFVTIPEFQGIATTVGQIFSGMVAGQYTVDEALAEAQSVADREMQRAVYY